MDLPLETPKLFVVATPIGNLEDISQRALKILASVDLIAAEDTRHTGSLLKALGLPNKPFVSYHDAVESDRALHIVQRMMAEGLTVALVSDAGTPCISDPGYRLVAEARAAGIEVSPIPGASALTALISASGLACHRVTFVGFLPAKAKALELEILSWKSLGGSVVFYESARRITKTLTTLVQHYPRAMLCIGREMTKMFEEVVQLTPQAAIAWSQNHQTLKGELAVMCEMRPLALSDEDFDRDAWFKDIHEKLDAGWSTKDLCKFYVDGAIPQKKSEIYAQILMIKESKR